MIEIYYMILGSILTVLAYFYASMLNTSFGSCDYKPIDHQGFYESAANQLRQENQQLREKLSTSDSELCQIASDLLNDNQDLNVNMTTIKDILMQSYYDKKIVSKKLITECGFSI